MPEMERKKGVLLTIWLILMLVGNLGFALTYLIIAIGLSASGGPSPLPLWAFYVLGIFGLLNFIFTIFLFMWKRWAFFAFAGSASIVFVINLMLGLGIIISSLGLIGPVILYLLLRSKWDLLE